MPLVSVVMPTYNSKYVWQAVDSILHQDFEDFEFIIVDGSPTNGLLEIFEQHGVIDKRIQIHYKPNLPCTTSRNYGCRLAKGKYIAAMDSDDISYSNRFSKQVAFLESHEEIGLVGSWRHDCDERGNITATRKPYTDPLVIRWSLNFGDCVTHSSVMARADLLQQIGFYDEGNPHSEDYSLIARASLVTGVANVPEVLTAYRYHSGQWTDRTPASLNNMATAKVMQYMIEDTLGYCVPMELVVDMRRIFVGLKISAGNIKQVTQIIAKAKEAYIKKNHLTYYEEKEINRDVNRMLFWIGVQAARKNHSLPILVKSILKEPMLPISALREKFGG